MLCRQPHAASRSVNDELAYWLPRPAWTSGETARPRCNPLRGNLLDGYAISREHTNEYRAHCLRLISFIDPIFVQPAGAPINCVNDKGFISDHFPLTAQFRITIDDD